MAHRREKLALRLIGVLGPLSRPGVVVDLHFQSGIGIGELRRAFRHQHLQLALVPPELRFPLLAFPLQLPLDHPLLLEDLHGLRHRGQLVTAGGVDRHVEVSPGQLLHDPGEGLEAPDDVALHVEPEDQPRYREDHHGLKEQGEEPGIHCFGRSHRRLLGERLRVFHQLHDEVTQRLRELPVPAGQGLDRGIEPQHLPPEPGHVVRTGGVGALQREQQLPSLPQTHRIGDAAHPPLENAKVPAESAFDPLDLVVGAGPQELIEQQGDLGRPQPQLEHALHQEHVLFVQPVECFQALLYAVLRLHQLVEIGNHRGGARGRVGDQGLREIGQSLGRLVRTRDGVAQTPGRFDTGCHQPVLRDQVVAQALRDDPRGLELGLGVAVLHVAIERLPEAFGQLEQALDSVSRSVSVAALVRRGLRATIRPAISAARRASATAGMARSTIVV